MYAGAQVQKTYVAIVYGHVEGNEGVVEIPMRPDPNDRPRQVVDLEGGKPAKTLWKVLERGQGRKRSKDRPSNSTDSCTTSSTCVSNDSNESTCSGSGTSSNRDSISIGTGKGSSDNRRITDSSGDGGSCNTHSSCSSARKAIPDFLGSNETSIPSPRRWLDSVEGPWTRVELKPVSTSFTCSILMLVLIKSYLNHSKPCVLFVCAVNWPHAPAANSHGEHGPSHGWRHPVHEASSEHSSKR